MSQSTQLPEAGSPGSLAAHPDRPWIAVGIKKGRFGHPQSAMVLAEVMSPRFDPAWRTPTVQGIARSVAEQWSSPQGHCDPAVLEVLADALEESGCADADLLA